MKPARLLEMLVAARSMPVSVNVFREILLSRGMQKAADLLENEVVAQMLNQRVDQEIRDIQTLRYMFNDIVNRPAVQDAYDQMLKAKGMAILDSTGKVKDEIIGALKGKLRTLQEEIASVSQQVHEVEKRARKEQKRAQYFKKEAGRLSSEISKRDKSRRRKQR